MGVYLARGFNAFPHGEIANQIDDSETSEIFPVDTAEIFQAQLSFRIQSIDLQTRRRRECENVVFSISYWKYSCAGETIFNRVNSAEQFS